MSARVPNAARGAVLVLAALAAGALADAQEDAPADVSFQRDVRPLLMARCAGCHQPAKAAANLSLVTHAELVADFDETPLVVAGKPEESYLVDVVTPFGDLPPEMPKDAPPLTEAERALLVEWIRAGAVDDSPDTAAALPSAEDPPIYPLPPVVTALAFAADGRHLAVSGRHEVLVHDTRAEGEAAAPVARLIGMSPRIESLAFSPDGSLLAAAGGAPGRFGELQVWKTADWTLAHSVPVTFDTVRGVSWSPDGALVALACTDNTVRAYDARSGAQVFFQGAHEDWALDTTFSLDGSHLISVGRDRSAKLTKVETQQFIDNITSITPGAMKGGLGAVECRPGADEILVGGSDGEPKLYRTYREKKRQIGDDYNLIRAFEGFIGRVSDVAWAPDGSRFFVGVSLSRLADPPRGGVVRAYAVDGAIQWTLTLEAPVYALALSPDGARLAASGFDGQVRLFAAADGAPVRTFSSVPLDAPADAEPIAPEAEPTIPTEPAEESAADPVVFEEERHP